tara:strand:+ start:5099 stop:5374 length:276 start_codon:yes stop_codon:yes gene_type:complete
MKNIINSIAQDKKDHVLLGMFIGYPLQIAGLILDILFKTYYFFLLGSFIALTLVGAKEIVHDWLMGRGNPEWWDFIASAIPIIATMIVYFI